MILDIWTVVLILYIDIIIILAYFSCKVTENQYFLGIKFILSVKLKRLIINLLQIFVQKLGICNHILKKYLLTMCLQSCKFFSNANINIKSASKQHLLHKLDGSCLGWGRNGYRLIRPTLISLYFDIHLQFCFLCLFLLFDNLVIASRSFQVIDFIP